MDKNEKTEDILLTEEYHKYFDTVEKEALAFRKLAREFYCGNFGTMSKSDIETFMFSEYIEKILDKSEDDERTYSDYTLSKQLGITQSKISGLKVRKQLRYPREFDIAGAFNRALKHYEKTDDNQIRVLITDKNLFYELENIVQESGRALEIQLNKRIFQLPCDAFVDLMMYFAPNEAGRNTIRKEIRENLRKNNIKCDDEQYFSSRSFKEIFKENCGKGAKGVVTGVLKCLSEKKDLGKISGVASVLSDIWEEFDDEN